MFYSLTGELLIKEEKLAVISCNGIAFSLQVPWSTVKKLGDIGEKATLYTYLNVKQDGVDLFGFFDRKELETFKLLIGVSGVGPKAALSLLSELSADSLALAISGGDYKALTKAPGIGPKGAKRIVLELKDKIGSTAGDDMAETFKSAVAEPGIGTAAADAVSALVNLGYSQSEASSAVGKVKGNLNTEEILKQALKQLM